MNIRLFLKRNSTNILTCIGCMGMVATTISGIKATSKAIKLIEKAEERKGETLTPWEKIKVIHREYIPTVTLGFATGMCMIGTQLLNQRQQASLISAYGLLDQTYKDYRRKCKEFYGEEADKRIIEAIAVENSESVFINASCLCTNVDLSLDENKGELVLWYDKYSSRFFKATLEKVLLAEYHVNRNYIIRGESTLNELYDFLGLERIDFGDYIGWMPYDEGDFWIEFNHVLSKLDDGTKFYIIDILFEPRLRYWEEPDY